jgi:hypothetical protein
VTYDSDAGNGLLGVGWDIPISSIQVDTRFGVPKYDLNNESETYSIDGELLVMDPNQPVRGARANFHRRSEGKFDTITRVGPGPIETIDLDPGKVGDSCHFEVVDKRGWHYFYGETYFSRGSVTPRGVYRWYLSRVIDPFGNQMLYTYNKTRVVLPGASSDGAPAVEIYPQEIDYTADFTTS